MTFASVIAAGLPAVSSAATPAAAAFPWASAIGAGANVLSGIVGNQSGKQQASALRNAAQSAEITARQGGRANLELLAPQIGVGNSALMTLARMYGLPIPEPVSVNEIARSVNPTADDMVSLGGRWYVDPRTGQKYQMAHKGSDSGQLYAKGGVDAQYAPGGPLNQAPQTQAGPSSTSAPSSFENFNAMIENNPGIQFVNEQGQKAIRRQNASRGRFLSGAQTKDAMRFAQGNAATNWQNMVQDPLFELAGFGPRGTAQGTNVINNMTSNVGNAQNRAGAARASGYETQGNAIGGAIAGAAPYVGDIVNWYRNR